MDVPVKLPRTCIAGTMSLRARLETLNHVVGGTTYVQGVILL